MFATDETCQVSFSFYLTSLTLRTMHSNESAKFYF